ncbi:Hypothetical predicted protein [Octopus vulgaris]|uniref:PiggyBac transposable element-derived protein domain-containing protein n=1 Tax=Octopus vulgaris TaxID=6645 RepID=A0AA36ASA8_OCTVU|nr:Hypothetical predicted protein [Octopus vulgaris]
MPRRENLSEDQISKRLLELDEEWEEDSSDSFYCSEDDGEIDCVLDSLGSVSSHDENTQKQSTTSHPIMNKQYVSRDRQDVWHPNPLAQATVRTSSCNIVPQQCRPSRIAKRSCDSIETSFTIFMRQNLLEVIRKWTNVEGQVVYKDKWKEIGHSGLIGLIILIGFFINLNMKMSNSYGVKKMPPPTPIFNKIMSRGRFQLILQVLRFDDASARRKKRSDDKLEPIREVFEFWNQN